jgi:hypothetical protein
VIKRKPVLKLTGLKEDKKMTTQVPQTINMSAEELVNMLEPLMRRIVREELTRLVAQEPDVFHLDVDSPLYEDMEEILRRKKQGQVKLYSHKEVWGD